MIKKKIKIIIKQKVWLIIHKYFNQKFKKELFETYHKNVKIVNTKDTLDEVEKTITNNIRGVYLRFGDGDVFLMNGKRDAYQDINDELSKEMKEAFSINGKGVIKCLAIHSHLYGYEEGMYPGNHLNTDDLSKELLYSTFLYFIGSKIYSPIALHFAASNNISKAKSFLKLLKHKTAVFVGNEKISKHNLEKIFGRVKHIKTPEKNSYDDIHRIYKESIKELSKLNSFSVVCVAMGCSGRPLMKRIYNDNYDVFLFDFGSLLDGIVGNKSRTWLKVNEIDYEDLLKDL